MSSKIVVLKLREILKTGLITLIGLVILGIIIFLFIPKNNTQAKYNPGTYSSEIILHSNPVLVEVSVSKDKILNIQLLNMGETQEVFYPLFERSIDTVANQVISTQSTDISKSVDNGITTDILVKAIDKALAEATK